MIVVPSGAVSKKVMGCSLGSVVVEIVINPEGDESVGQHCCDAGIDAGNLPFGERVRVVADVIARQIGNRASRRIVDFYPIIIFKEIVHNRSLVIGEDFVDAQVGVLGVSGEAGRQNYQAKDAFHNGGCKVKLLLLLDEYDSCCVVS